MYFTKAGITPIEFRGMMQAVFILRAKRNGKLKLHEELFPHWAEQAYMLGNAVFNQVEQEEMESVGGEGESDFALKGKGDSGAFSAIFDYMQESDARSKGDAGT